MIYNGYTISRNDINDVAKDMLCDNKLSMEQRRGIKKLLKKINLLENVNKDNQISYQLGYQDGVRDTINK